MTSSLPDSSGQKDGEPQAPGVDQDDHGNEAIQGGVASTSTAPGPEKERDAPRAPDASQNPANEANREDSASAAPERGAQVPGPGQNHGGYAPIQREVPSQGGPQGLPLGFMNPNLANWLCQHATASGKGVAAVMEDAVKCLHLHLAAQQQVCGICYWCPLR